MEEKMDSPELSEILFDGLQAPPAKQNSNWDNKAEEYTVIRIQTSIDKRGRY
jgi:hypothetical protein